MVLDVVFFIVLKSSVCILSCSWSGGEPACLPASCVVWMCVCVITDYLYYLYEHGCKHKAFLSFLSRRKYLHENARGSCLQIRRFLPFAGHRKCHDSHDNNLKQQAISENEPDSL